MNTPLSQTPLPLSLFEPRSQDARPSSLDQVMTDAPMQAPSSTPAPSSVPPFKATQRPTSTQAPKPRRPLLQLPKAQSTNTITTIAGTKPGRAAEEDEPPQLPSNLPRSAMRNGDFSEKRIQRKLTFLLPTEHRKDSENASRPRKRSNSNKTQTSYWADDMETPMLQIITQQFERTETDAKWSAIQPNRDHPHEPLPEDPELRKLYSENPTVDENGDRKIVDSEHSDDESDYYSTDETHKANDNDEDEDDVDMVESDDEYTGLVWRYQWSPRVRMRKRYQQMVSTFSMTEKTVIIGDGKGLDAFVMDETFIDEVKIVE